jgi:hypothetical protein
MTIEEYVDALVAKAPPLSERQRERLALIFATARAKRKARTSRNEGDMSKPQSRDMTGPRMQGTA